MNASGYKIDVRDWRSGALQVQKPNGEVVRTTLSEISGARAGDKVGQVYAALHLQAARAVADARLAEIKRCPGHVAIETQDFGFTGPVSRDENRSAHGNICQHETCRCGAERRSNINGRHIEQGDWI